MNNYYVYEFIRLDTNEPFYVGMGHKNRWKDLKKRNEYFKRIVKKYFVAVNILHNNLDRQTAFGLECYYIWLYRDIIGYEMCNIADGGEGCVLVGKSNPMYGKYGKDNPNYGRQRSEETKRKMKENHTDVGGENNPMYGKQHSNETKRKIGKSVICITTKKIFHISKEGAEYYNCDISGIIKCCKGKYKSAGKYNGKKLVWRYITWNHNKKYRIKK